MTTFTVLLKRASRRKRSKIVKHDEDRDASRRKRSKITNHGEDTGADLISKLPDEILHHILSFLPTKYVIRTSILSKRWQNLWTAVSNIDIQVDGRESDNPIRSESLLDAVKNVLIYHEDTNIDKLCLSFKMPFDSLCVDNWIYAALERNVKELYLCLNIIGLCYLDIDLFNSESLTRLRLCMVCTFHIAGTIHLPNLKEMYLSLVTFEDKSSAELLFSNCPLLEELSLINCGWEDEDVKHITISTPSLSSLTFAQYQCPNILDGKELDGEMEVHAPNLVKLDFNSALSAILVVKPVAPSLVTEAHMSMYMYYDYDDNGSGIKVAHRCIKMLSGIQCVRSLVISLQSLGCLLGAKDLSSDLPVFPNLTRLQVVDGPMGYSYKVKILLDLLQKSPNLKVLEFDEELVENYWRFQVSPHLMSCLKIININSTGRLQAPTRLMKYLLKRSPALERVKINCKDDELEYIFNGEQFTEQLFNLPRCSPADLIVEFLHYEFYDPHGNKVVDAHCPKFQRYLDSGGLSRKLGTTIKQDKKKQALIV